jgi:hypothetical protein
VETASYCWVWMGVMLVILLLEIMDVLLEIMHVLLELL